MLFGLVKIYNCIAFTNFHHKIHSFQNLSLGFIDLKIFLKFRKFQPRYSYKKECIERSLS